MRLTMNDRPTGWYYITTPKVTGMIYIEEGIIKKAPPVYEIFEGQPAANLVRWLKSKGEFGWSKFIPK